MPLVDFVWNTDRTVFCDGVEGFEIYGLDTYLYAFLNDEYPNKVEYDLQAVINQANLEQQTAENHRQSAINKLTALGLNEVEINALIG